MAALLLGLVTAAAKGSFDSQDAAIKTAAADVLTLDRLLARYGPETDRTRTLLKQIVAARMEATWPTSGSRRGILDASIAESKGSLPGEAIETQILQLPDDTDARRWYKTEALKPSVEVLKTRWLLLSRAGGSIQHTVLAAVIFWLAMIFGSFAVGAPRNGTLVAVFGSSGSPANRCAIFLRISGVRPYFLPDHPVLSLC